ncbi:MAG: PorV/PorQ family protein [Elusimicrobiota bacterium]|nr:PorV/PorQ family protein [Elusimicrobiota bacterium]
MKSIYKNIILLLVSILVLPAAVSAEPGTTAANFLKLPQGNRATAMGENFTAFASGPEALYWNPAGLATGLFNEGRLIYNRWIEGTFYGYGGYRHNIKGGGIGAAVTYLDSGSIEKRESGRESNSSYKMRDVSFDIGQAMTIRENYRAGVSLKFIYESIDGESANALAAGLGGQFFKRIEEHYLNIGLAIMNLGTKMGYDSKYPLPAVIRAGAGDELLGGRLRGSLQGDYYITEQSILGGAGIEFRATPMFDLRAGYNFGREAAPFPYGITAGFGVRYAEMYDYLFDYSISSAGNLGFVHRAGVGLQF